MFNFVRSRSISTDNDTNFLKEANLQIELMHSELELTRLREKQLQEENTTLKYQLAELSKQNKYLLTQMKIIQDTLKPVEQLNRALKRVKPIIDQVFEKNENNKVQGKSDVIVNGQNETVQRKENDDDARDKESEEGQAQGQQSEKET